MQQLNIKPLSVNAAYTGVRYRTDAYKMFDKLLTLSLRPMIIPKGKLLIRFEFGVSSMACDWDNNIKAAQDILAKKYGFNDKLIYKGIVEKFDVPKGKEFIRFSIEPYEQL